MFFTYKIKRFVTIILLLAISVTSATFTESAYAKRQSNKNSPSYPWSRVMGGTTGDYIADSYNDVNSGHVFESVTQERLLDILSSSGNYYIVFGGPGQETSQTVLSTINAQAKAAGVTKIYHFDPFVDGYQIDITDEESVFTTGNGLSVNQLWSRITDLLPEEESVESYTSGDTLLFLYNKESAPKINAHYSLSDISSFDSDTEASKIAKIFRGGDDSVNAPIIKGDTRSDFDFFKRVYNASATYFNYNNGNGPDVQGNRTGEASTQLITDADKEGFALHQVNFPELLNLLNSSGDHVIFFGASWCHNTQAIIRDVVKKAKKYGHKTVYVYDTTLGNQLTFGTGNDIDKVTSSSSAFNTRNNVNTENGRGNISYVYGELVKYLGDFITENNSKKNNSISYYPNGDLQDTVTSAPSWEGGGNAIRLQLPFLFSYNKEAAKPVTKQWLHKNTANDGTYTEYMLELTWVLKTPNAIAAAGEIDGLSKVNFASEAVAALDNVLSTKGLTPVTPVPVPTSLNKFTSVKGVTVNGKAKVGKTLSAKTSAWTPAAGFTYQWYADGKVISGAVKSKYKVSNAVLGKRISIKVTGELAGYQTETRVSAQTARVVSDFKSAPVPTIRGKAKVGSTLKVKVGSWKPKPKFSYQWFANGKKMKGAVKAKYKIKKSLKGKKITVRVTAQRTNYVTAAKDSKATKKVK